MCFLCNFSFWLSVRWYEWSVKIFYLYCQFLPLCLLVFFLCIEVLLYWVHQFSSVQFSRSVVSNSLQPPWIKLESRLPGEISITSDMQIGCIDIYNCYVFLLDWSLDRYVVSFLISCNLLYFKVYFVRYEDCYSSFLLVPICMEYIFYPLTFRLYVSWGLKWVSYRQKMYGSYFCIHSASLCLFLVGAFNPLTFKVIINIYVPISIFLIVWGWFCSFFLLLYFLTM